MKLLKTVSDIPEPAPQIFDEVTVQNVSLNAVAPLPVPPKTETVVSPSKAEKQSFDKLIQSLDTAGAGQ